MRIQRQASSLVACVLVATIATAPGCRSMHTVKPDTTAQQPAAWKVKPGDDIRLTLKDGRTLRLVVAAVETDAIVERQGSRVALSEIQTLERRQFSAGRTVAAIAGGILGALVMLTIVVANSLSGLGSE